MHYCIVSLFFFFSLLSCNSSVTVSLSGTGCAHMREFSWFVRAKFGPLRMPFPTSCRAYDVMILWGSADRSQWRIWWISLIVVVFYAIWSFRLYICTWNTIFFFFSMPWRVKRNKYCPVVQCRFLRCGNCVLLRNAYNISIIFLSRIFLLWLSVCQELDVPTWRRFLLEPIWSLRNAFPTQGPTRLFCRPKCLSIIANEEILRQNDANSRFPEVGEILSAALWMNW